MIEKPISRILPVLFANTVLALIWTKKFNTTKNWLIFEIISWGLWIGSAILINYNEIFSSSFFVAFVLFLYRMSKMCDWVEDYNMKNFGFITLHEWKKSKIST